MDRIAGPLFGVAFIAVVAMGFYTYTMRTELAEAKAALTTLQQNRDGFKQKLEEVGKKAATTAVALDSCNTQLKEAQTKIESSSKKTAARR